MPSPVGHAIGGITGGWLAAGRPASRRAWVGQAVLLGAVGALPDIDLLFGAHSGPTHSLGAALIAGLAAAVGALLLKAGPVPVFRAAAAVTVAWASHVFLDWLGEDTSAPLGVMALWPFSREHFMSPVPVMPAITRRYWLEGFLMQNFRALVFELAVLLPILAAVWIARRVELSPGRKR